ncbi:hypothetical protein [Cellulomonas chengniuliangii]|uniref:hypothetical protein n=1 Tax=Cellulomonas chengniuliangii TaxID=2968084 RepID=UPI001D0E388E|nr:hypothetical protein [Cellulomonas chengniuliangii]MCC2317430.1 hypothetical protein [Cellulomonas chengniuliangii]
MLLGLGGWTLAISPALTTASDTRAEALDVTARNEALERELVKLKEQHKNLDVYRGQVAAIEAQIPASAELDVFMRQVAAHAEATGAFVVSVAAAVPVNFVPGATVAPAAAAEPAEGEGDAEADGSTDSAAETAAPAAAPSIDGFVAIPVDITLLGNPFNVTRMLAALQAGDQRLFMVTSFTGKGTDEEEAGEGRPATAEGDLELTVSGYLYVLKGPATTQDGEDAPAEPLPSGALEGNPMTGA